MVREVAEEVGVHVADLRYIASQPWPYPGSLMLGFHALADPTSSSTPTRPRSPTRAGSPGAEIRAAAAGDPDAGFAHRQPVLDRPLPDHELAGLDDA